MYRTPLRDVVGHLSKLFEMAGRLQNLLRAQAEGKALGPHPAFMDPGTPVSTVDLNIFRTPRRPSGKLSQTEAVRHMQAYGGNEAIDWVMDCVRYTADTVANADYHFENKKPLGQRAPGNAIAPPQALADLLAEPNPYMDYIELMELLVIDLLLVGNAYWYKYRVSSGGQPLAIYRLAPGFVKVDPEPWGIRAYHYKVPNVDQIEIAPSEVIHFKLANPHSPYYGIGLVQGAGRSADLELALADTQASYFENHAMPSVVAHADRRIPRDVVRNLAATLRARGQGPAKAGELLILEAGLKLETIAPNAAQAAFDQLTRLSRDRIFAWFRMSPKLLGIGDENTGADKIQDFQRIFDTKTARPLMNKLQKKISRELSSAWGDIQYAIDYEYQMPPEDMARLAGGYATVPGITVDEVRKFAGLPPHDDKTIGSTTLALPGQNGGTGQPGDTASRNGHPDPNLPGEAGRPPLIENTRAFPRAGQSMPPSASAIQGQGKALSIAEIEARIDALAIGEKKALPAHAQPPEDVLAPRRIDDIDAIVADFHAELAAAARTLERAMLDHVEGKASESNMIQRIRNSPAWATFRTTVQAAYSRAIKRAASTAAVHHGEMGVTPQTDINYQNFANQLIADKASGVSAITKTLKDRVAAAVKPLRDGGATREEMIAAAQAAVADWGGTQAETIALTEATRGYNLGTLAVAEAAGVQKVHVSDGTDHDAPCKEAHGQTWDVAHARDHLLEHPRCRRAFVPVISGQ